MTHDHSDAFFQTNVDNQTPEWKYRLRQHVKEAHGASNDWATMVDADLIAERHNLDHDRDVVGIAR